MGEFGALPLDSSPWNAPFALPLKPSGTLGRTHLHTQDFVGDSLQTSRTCVLTPPSDCSGYPTWVISRARGGGETETLTKVSTASATPQRKHGPLQSVPRWEEAVQRFKGHSTAIGTLCTSAELGAKNCTGGKLRQRVHQRTLGSKENLYAPQGGRGPLPVMSPR